MKVGAPGNYTTVYENGKDITLDSANNTNAMIEKIIGVPYELFVRIVAFSASQTPFLNLPVRSPYAANQTDIIEELFELKTLSEKAESLKLEIKDTEASLKTQVERIDYVKAEHERHAKQLESAKRRVIEWEKAHETQIIDFQDRLTKLQQIDFEEQNRIRTVAEGFEQTSVEHQEKYNSFLPLQKKSIEAHNHLRHLKKGECPYCEQQYINNQQKIQQCEADIKAFEDIREEFSRVGELYEENKNRAYELKKKLKYPNEKDQTRIQAQEDILKQRLTDLHSATNPHIETLQELEAIELETIDMSKINELKSLLDHQTFLLKLLTKKDSFVRKALLNKNIPFLNQRLQKYLADLDLPHQVEFTHEMTASISRFGHPMDFGNLSNGQRARVNLALSFAFRDVLQSMHEFVNICMLDEVLDVGLDAVGVQAAARMLKRKARDEKLALYIISHRDEIDSAFDRKMIVQMSGGFSSIRYEDG
jgi:DNA repair exonuclease SbcCD ATPase subunit